MVVIVTVAVVTVVIVTCLVKTTWHLDSRWNVLSAAFRDSHDVCIGCISFICCIFCGGYTGKTVKAGKKDKTG